MKIRIVKFMELSNVEFGTPVKIEAGHDVGKSTIFRAVLFAITGKDVDGKEFDGRIYPKKVNSISDLNVEVQIEQGGVVFTKKATGNEKRAKGSDETELLRSVTASYSIDYRVVGKSEYDAKINEVFGNFHLFCNPDYFKGLKKEEKRAIFASLVTIDRNAYFAGLGDKKTVSGRIADQKKQIEDKQAALKENLAVTEPKPIEFIDYEKQLSELRSEREKAEPKFTDFQLKENGDIYFKLADIEKSVFVPEPSRPLLPNPQKPVLADVAKLQKQLEENQLLEPDTKFIDTQVSRMKEKIQKIKSLTLQIENYDENVKQAKCTLCQVCTAPDCQFKRIEFTPLEDLQSELSGYMTLDEAENSLKNLESGKIDYLRKFESDINETIQSFTDAIVRATESNKSLTEKFDKYSKEVDEKNAEITGENAKIELSNLSKKATFNTDKAQKISDLKKQLHILPPLDYSEIDSKIEEITKLQKEQQTAIDTYNEANGSFKYAQGRISVLTDEIEKMKQVLFAHERELLKIETAEYSYYLDFENMVNAEMPEHVNISLFKKNLSNDDYSECFEIEFNGSIYAGNGKTIAFYIWLCGWFQSKFGKDLPIFIDEAIILNESLYSDVKNTVILMRNDNCKTLKITQLWEN